MQGMRLSPLLLLAAARGSAADIAFDITASSDPFYFNEGGSVGIVGGSLGGKPVMCYRDYGNLEDQASLTCTVLASASAASTSDDSTVVVSEKNSPSVSFAELDSATGVVCYAADYRNNGRPTCNVISVTGTSISKGDDVVIDADLTSKEKSTYIEHTTVGGLSSDRAVMCYRTKDSTATIGVLRCASLARVGNTLTVESTAVLNTAFTTRASVVGFSDSKAMVCYSDDLTPKDQGGCSALAISSSGALTVPLAPGSTLANWVSLQPSKTTDEVVVTRLSSDTALVCYSEAAGSGSGGVAGDCAYVEVSASAVTIKGTALGVTSGAISHMALQSFSDETAVLCYQSSSQAVCVEMFASASLLTKGEPLAIAGAKANHGFGISSLSESEGVVCYTEEGSGNEQEFGTCVPVDVVPTSTSTETTSTSTPHTTTASSTITTASSTTTLSDTTTSSTPHTTTATSTSTETVTGTTVTTATGTTATSTGMATEDNTALSGASRPVCLLAAAAVLLAGLSA